MAVVWYVLDKVLNRDHWSFVRTNAWKSLFRKMKTLHWKLTSFWIGSQLCIVFWLVWKRLPYSIIRDHFKAHLNHPKESKLQPFNNQKLSSKSIYKLQNKRSHGYDHIPTELLKYTWTELHDLIAEPFSNIFAKHEDINVGNGLLTALQKPGEQKVPTKSLCPVNLFIMLRKVISNIVLTRIQPIAYLHGRSTSDIVWCHRFLAARVQKSQ